MSAPTVEERAKAEEICEAWLSTEGAKVLYRRCSPGEEFDELLTQIAAALHAHAEAARQEPIVLLQRIADAKDSMDWWADLDRFLNAAALQARRTEPVKRATRVRQITGILLGWLFIFSIPQSVAPMGPFGSLGE